MKQFLLAFFVFFIPLLTTFAQSEGWSVLADVQFDIKYSQEAQEYLMFPNFGKEVIAKEGKFITLEGHVMPLDLGTDAYIVLSRYPFSQCFFCGQAGPETVAAIYFKTPQSGFAPDERLRVKGRLRLNGTDIDKLNYTLEDAVVLKK
jgi:hypothetical protein